MIAAILRDTPIPIRELAPELPEDAGRIFARALAKEPDERYPDITAFADALGALTPALSRAPSRPASTPPPRPSAVSSDLANARTVSAPVDTVRRPEPNRPPRLRAGRATWTALAGVVAAGALGAYWLWSRHPSPPPALVAKPHTAGAVVACPAFHTTGLKEPIDPADPDAGTVEAAWLGAAAASIACARVQAGLGQRDDLVRAPAELVGLPREPKDAFPLDPYGAPDARTTAIAEAERLGADWLDGTLGVLADGFTVDLTLRQSDGAEVARSTGHAGVLFQAVRAAMAPLYQAGHLGQAPDDDMHLVDWTGATTAEGARALLDIALAIVTEDEVSTKVECAAAERPDLTESARYFARAACADRLFLPRPAWPHPLDTSRAALDAMSNHEIFATGAIVRKASGPDVKRAVADAIADRVKTESDAMQRASLAAMAAELYNEVSKRELSATQARRAIQATPKQFDLRAFAWHRLAFTADYAAEIAASHCAWVPWEPVAALNITDLAYATFRPASRARAGRFCSARAGTTRTRSAGCCSRPVRPRRPRTSRPARRASGCGSA